MDGSDNDEELQGMLEAMMQQLMSKEVLYEPLKELHEKVCIRPPSTTNLVVYVDSSSRGI